MTEPLGMRQTHGRRLKFLRRIRANSWRSPVELGARWEASVYNDLRYLMSRGLIAKKKRKGWGFIRDFYVYRRTEAGTAYCEGVSNDNPGA